MNAMVPPVTILIPAAGSSSRMHGTDKLLHDIAGEPMLRRSVRVALATGMPVTVVLSPAFPARLALLQDLACSIAHAPDAELGLSASLRRGIRAVRAQPRTSGLMILPADMPLFTATALSEMVTAFGHARDRILRGAAANGQPGHPVIFPRDLWTALEQMRGDAGGRGVLATQAARVDLHPLPGQMASLDLDTPEDWAAFGASMRAQHMGLMRP
jgi:molybdenum cofactor cytidylyltransferase